MSQGHIITRFRLLPHTLAINANDESHLVTPAFHTRHQWFPDRLVLVTEVLSSILKYYYISIPISVGVVSTYT